METEDVEMAPAAEQGERQYFGATQEAPSDVGKLVCDSCIGYWQELVHHRFLVRYKLQTNAMNWKRLSALNPLSKHRLRT
jgi:hypothetical protein